MGGFTAATRPAQKGAAARLRRSSACSDEMGWEDREESERFHSFSLEKLVARDKANLDITWLRDASLEDMDNLPAPEVIAREIVDDLTAALAEFKAVAAALEPAGSTGTTAS